MPAVAVKFGAQNAPPQGDAVRGQRFDVQFVSIDREPPPPEFQTELFFIVGQDAPELLDLHPVAAAVDRRLTVKPARRLAEHPPEPFAQGKPPAPLFFHARSLPIPAVQGNAPCSIYMEAEGLRMYQIGLFLLAVLAGALPFAVPQACGQALREGLALCAGPLLLSLFPFLVVSSLLVQCPAGDLLAIPLRPAAWCIGVQAPCAARVLLIGLFGGFAPAANAAAQAVRTGQLTPRQADALLPACVCSGPSFVVLTVGQTLLHSTELGILLFLAQLSAGYLTAALLNRLSRAEQPATCTAPPPEAPPPQLTDLLTHATMAYLKLCGFVLFFRMLAAGVGAVFPPAVGIVCAMLLEVCSGCDLAARTGPWGSLLCCAALSVQGLSVLLQVRALCPPEMTLRPLLAGRLLHLPLSVGLFWLLLPQGEQSVFSTLPPQVVPMRRLPPDCLLLVFFVCCLAVCQLTRLLQKPDPEPKETVVNRAER